MLTIVLRIILRKSSTEGRVDEDLPKKCSQKEIWTCATFSLGRRERTELNNLSLQQLNQHKPLQLDSAAIGSTMPSLRGLSIILSGLKVIVVKKRSFRSSTTIMITALN